MRVDSYSNLDAYWEIACQALADMEDASERGRRPKDDGTEGSIITWDPTRKSFKCASIAVAFFGIWLEAYLHILIVRGFSKTKCREFDRKRYRDKVELLGIADPVLLAQIDQFQDGRNELIHEKAFMNAQTLRIAQSEASHAHKVMREIRKHIEGPHA